MNIAKAHFPQLMLMSTLLTFAGKMTAPKTVASIVTTEKPIPPLEKPVTIAQKPVEKPKQVSKPQKTTAAQHTAGEFDWHKVLVTAKKREAPLYSVLSRATMSYDGTTVTLGFQYALHRKKLEQPQYRTKLARLIEDVCGVTPEVVITAPGSHVAENEVTRSVADIMGGGEVVHA